MAEVVDFAKFSSLEDALKAWLELSLSIRIGINIPSPNPDPNLVSRIDPPFPWSADRRATVRSLHDLISNGVTSIKGEVRCRRCDRRGLVSYDLMPRFREVERFVRARAHVMHERAPAEWMSPVLGDCGHCGQPGCMRPVLGERKRNYNWLFLFLGQSLGVCTLGQLKWFCKHSRNHRTGAKDRVLYLTYMTIGKQLDPEGVFN